MSTAAHGKFSGQRLVIFGCGYVGAAVAESALAQGVEVAALTRNPDTAAALRAGGIRTIVGELADDGWYDQLGDAPDMVLNCVSSGGGGTEGYRRSYVAGMDSILRWARSRAGVGTIVYTSSTSVYPQGDGRVVDEAAPVAGSDERAALLVEAERRLAENQAACRRWFILRLAGIYGPGRHHLCEQVRAGVIAGAGVHRLNLAHRGDIVAAVWACFGAPPTITNQVFNVADDGAAPKREVADWLAARLGVPAPRFTGAPAEGRRTVTPNRVIANHKLKATLGWSPQFPSYREGYAAILASQ